VTLPPDDLPRSPTGRVPQWVYDENAGWPTAHDRWRGATAGPGSVGWVQPPYQGTAVDSLAPWRRRLQPFLVAFVVLVGVAGLVAGAAQRNSGWFADSLAGTSGTTANLFAPTLPSPAGRTFPIPGVEELAAPRGVPPVISVPSTRYSFTKTQTAPDGRTVPVAWSPCRTIHYVVNTTGAPADFSPQVVMAMADLTAATGLQFVADGVTGEPPAPSRAYFQPERYGDRWAPVLIAFGDAGTLPALAGDVAGVGGYASATDDGSGLMVAVTGDVYVDSAVLAMPNVQGAPAYLPVLRHELGHLLGLGHVDDLTQLMNPATTTLTAYQDGDLTGLAALGRGACAPDL